MCYRDRLVLTVAGRQIVTTAYFVRPTPRLSGRVSVQSLIDR